MRFDAGNLERTVLNRKLKKPRLQSSQPQAR